MRRLRFQPDGRGDVSGGTGGTGGSDSTKGGNAGCRDRIELVPDRRVARRLLIPPAVGGVSGASRVSWRARAGVRHAGGNPGLRGCRPGMTLLPCTLVENARRAGQVGVHALPPEEALVRVAE